MEIDASMTKWTPDLETGHETIDAQHKGIFRLIDRFFGFSQEEHVAEIKLSDALVFLLGYTLSHFLEEELLMETFDYPGMEAHVSEHKNFQRHLNELTQDYITGHSKDVTKERLGKILIRWPRAHIKTQDLVLAEYIAELPEEEFEGRSD